MLVQMQVKRCRTYAVMRGVILRCQPAFCKCGHRSA